MLLLIFSSRSTFVSAKPFSRDWSEMAQAKPRSLSWTLSNFTLVDTAELRGQWWKFSSESVSGANTYLEGSDTEITRIPTQILIWNSEITVFLRHLLQDACWWSELPPCTIVPCPGWLLWNENWGQNHSTRTRLEKGCKQSFLDLFSHCFWILQTGSLLWELWLKPLDAVIHDLTLFHN